MSMGKKLDPVRIWSSKTDDRGVVRGKIELISHFYESLSLQEYVINELKVPFVENPLIGRSRVREDRKRKILEFFGEFVEFAEAEHSNVNMRSRQ
jgi:hypothetical protein